MVSSAVVVVVVSLPSIVIVAESRWAPASDDWWWAPSAKGWRWVVRWDWLNVAVLITSWLSVIENLIHACDSELLVCWLELLWHETWHHIRV